MRAMALTSSVALPTATGQPTAVSRSRSLALSPKAMQSSSPTPSRPASQRSAAALPMPGDISSTFRGEEWVTSAPVSLSAARSSAIMAASSVRPSSL